MAQNSIPLTTPASVVDDEKIRSPDSPLNTAASEYWDLEIQVVVHALIVTEILTQRPAISSSWLLDDSRARSWTHSANGIVRRHIAAFHHTPSHPSQRLKSWYT